MVPICSHALGFRPAPCMQCKCNRAAVAGAGLEPQLESFGALCCCVRGQNTYASTLSVSATIYIQSHTVTACYRIHNSASYRPAARRPAAAALEPLPVLSLLADPGAPTPALDTDPPTPALAAEAAAAGAAGVGPGVGGGVAEVLRADPSSTWAARLAKLSVERVSLDDRSSGDTLATSSTLLLPDSAS